MLHWPDSMFSYIPEDKLLISSDAFGQHWATTERFSDQVPAPELMEHSLKYYANILTLFSPNVRKLLEKVGDLGLDIDMIAPDHGLIWRDNPGDILAAYDKWSNHTADKRALILYDSMWHSTEKMAKAVSNGLLSQGINTKIMSAKLNHRSDIMVEVMKAKAIILGSPTLNNGILPTMADVCTYVKGLRPRKKVGAAFGSFGWSGEAVKHLNGYLEEMQCDIVHDGLKVKNVPTHEHFGECYELGVKVGQAVNEALTD